jgi:GntR family transcriptional regulator
MAKDARYREIAEELRNAVGQGAYGPGGRLPSEGALAEQYGVSRGTIRQALMILGQDGMVTSRRGTRRVVLDAPLLQDFTNVQTFGRWARAIGEVPGGQVMRKEWGFADADEQVQLRIGEGGRVLRILRQRTLSGRPVMVERTSYSEVIGELIDTVPLDVPSVLDVFEANGVFMADVIHTIDLVFADRDDVKALGCRIGDPLLRERRRSTDPTGAPIEWSQDRYLPGTVAFMVHNSTTSAPLARQRG